MSTEQFSRPGAVDLSALRPTADTAAGSSGGGGAPAGVPGTYSFDVTEQDFQAEVVDPSLSHPVVLALWSSRAPASRDAVDVLSRVADAFEGRISLARMDIDANAQLAQTLQVRAVPYVLALLRGQPVPLFEGSVDEERARQTFDQVVEAAVQNGVTGQATPRGPADEGAAEEPADDDAAAEEPVDPRFAEGDAALERGDYAAAAASYRALLEASPADAEAGLRLAQADLLARTAGVDAATALAAAADRPDDLDAQLLAADMDAMANRLSEAFDRVIALVPRIFGDDRERARRHLLELFAVAGGEDPRVGDARRRLANALF